MMFSKVAFGLMLLAVSCSQVSAQDYTTYTFNMTGTEYDIYTSPDVYTQSLCSGKAAGSFCESAPPAISGYSNTKQFGGVCFNSTKFNVVYCVRSKAPRGPKGNAGANGVNGAKGPGGNRGLDGDTGPNGNTGPKGLQGNNGVRGFDGATGKPGVGGNKCPAGIINRIKSTTYSGAGPVGLTVSCDKANGETFMAGSCTTDASLDWNVQSSLGDAASTTQACRFKKALTGTDTITGKVFAMAHCCATSGSGSATVTMV